MSQCTKTWRSHVVVNRELFAVRRMQRCSSRCAQWCQKQDEDLVLATRFVLCRLVSFNI